MMARRFWLLSFIGVFVGVVGLSFSVAVQHRAFDGLENRVQEGLLQAQRDVRVLHAEWSFLNGSVRLGALNERYVFLSGVSPVLLEHGARAQRDDVCGRGTC